jgi:hypothetical protein
MNIESLLSDWDGETVIVRHDKPTGAWIFVDTHSTRLGLAGGGTRSQSPIQHRSAANTLGKTTNTRWNRVDYSNWNCPY